MSFTIHRNNRKKIKKTLRYAWVTYSKNNTANVKCAFLLGEINETQLTADASKEIDACRFKDIINKNILDAYVNLRYKEIIGFKLLAARVSI